MKLAIIGSRTFNDVDKLNEMLEPYLGKVTLVISGGAVGADTLGEQWAKRNNIETQIFLPDWETHKKKAGFIRNEDIVRNCDELIAFWDFQSKGTMHSISLCPQFNKPYKLVKI